jgi:hypothetical protein
MVLTDDMWLAPKIAAMMAMYPMMKQAVARMNTENVKTVTTGC